MQPPACIPDGKPPCPSCPVSRVCPWGAEILVHDPRVLSRKCATTDRERRRFLSND